MKQQQSLRHFQAEMEKQGNKIVFRSLGLMVLTFVSNRWRGIMCPPCFDW